MQKKKILFIYYKLFKAGGVAKVMSNLANELVKQGYEVEILLMTNNVETFYSLDENIKIYTVDMFSHWAWKICEFNVKYLKFIPKIQNLNSYISHIGVYLLLKNWLQKNHQNYDTIISCWYKLSKIISFFNKIRNKTIAWEHISHTSHGAFWGKLLKNQYKYVNAVVYTNKAGEIFNKSINSKTITIYNMMDDYCENKEFIPTENKDNIISIIARLDPEKNISEFLDIIKETKIPDNWSVKIMGDGYLKHKLLEKAKKENIKVEFLGIGNIAAVYKLINKSKINCLTSTTEALPTILIQAMFCSNVLIAYDCNYGPSDIINENNGFLIPLGDKQMFREKLEYLMMNENIYNNLNKSSYKESQKWKKDKILEKWIEII